MDASKKEGNNNSIGWIKINVMDKVLIKGFLRILNDFGVMELELVAIFIVLPSIKAEAKVEINTDNLSVYCIWKQLFNNGEFI